MAISDEQLAQLRLMIDEVDESIWSNVALSALFEANGSDLRAVAKTVWETKAASLVGAVDTTESGSSRRMSQEFDHAIKMAEKFGSSISTDTVVNAPRSTKIVRPTRGV